MKTTLHTASPSQIETECLVVPVLDTAESNNGDKSVKPKPRLQTVDKAVIEAAADLIASGEVAGKMLETTLLHKPVGLKAKRPSRPLNSASWPAPRCAISKPKT
jgi:hypothetical protein